MNILEIIKNSYYETPIKKDPKYKALCKRSDEFEEMVETIQDEQIKKLFKDYSEHLVEYACFLEDTAMEYCYNKIKEILKDLINFDLK